MPGAWRVLCSDRSTFGPEQAPAICEGHTCAPGTSRRVQQAVTVELVPKQRIPRAAFWAALGNTRTLSQSQKDDNRRQAYDDEMPISSLYSGSLLRAAQLESHCLAACVTVRRGHRPHRFHNSNETLHQPRPAPVLYRKPTTQPYSVRDQAKLLSHTQFATKQISRPLRSRPSFPQPPFATLSKASQGVSHYPLSPIPYPLQFPPARGDSPRNAP